MRYTIFSFLLLISCTINLSASQKSAEEFLKIVRKPQLTEAWALMSGEAVHKRAEYKKDGEVVQEEQILDAPIRLGMRFMSDAMIGQLVFNKNEVYSIGQNFADGMAGTTVTHDNKEEVKKPLLPEFGLRPSDLTLSFLYWKFEKEFEPERVNAQMCRVMELKHPANKESVKVWLSVKYAFPIKVEWYKDGKIQRGAEFKDFKEIKEQNMVMIKKLKIENRASLLSDNWMTMITFDDISASKMSKKQAPKDLFIKAK